MPDALIRAFLIEAAPTECPSVVETLTRTPANYNRSDSKFKITEESIIQTSKIQKT